MLISPSSCDVAISEGPVNLSWPAIMKTVNDDPYGFYEEGGWTFLTGGGEDGSDSESEEGSEFEDSDDGDDDASSSDSDSESDCESTVCPSPFSRGYDRSHGPELTR